MGGAVDGDMANLIVVQLLYRDSQSHSFAPHNGAKSPCSPYWIEIVGHSIALALREECPFWVLLRIMCLLPLICKVGR
jgi:hypothetical protein